MWYNMSMKKSGIYCILNLINGKRYVGSSVDIKARWARHKYNLKKNKHPNKHLQAAWNKCGKNSFVFEIQELCAVELLKEREEYWIQNYRSYRKQNGYNKSRFKDGITIYSAETKKKISAENGSNTILNWDKVKEIRKIASYC